MHRLDMEHRLVKVPARLRSTVDDAVASGLFMDVSDLAIHMMRELLLAEPSTARAAYVSFGPVPAMEDTFAVTLRIPRGMVREAGERGYGLARLAAAGIALYGEIHSGERQD